MLSFRTLGQCNVGEGDMEFGLMMLKSVLLIAIFGIFVSVSSSEMNLLIFGGNGFIGGETTRLLLAEGHKLTLVSRGKRWEWDTEDAIRPFVNHVKCDRYKPEKESCQFWDLIQKEDLHFDAVIDFSAYKVRAVTPFYNALKAKTSRYIYISSDSVYEVCELKNSEEDSLLREDDAVRPSNHATQEELNAKDSYGHNKLRVEEFLKGERESNSDGIPYVFLRLPDVLGPRDTTDRYWKYHLWMKYNKELGKPITIPSFAEKLSTSYVYVRDVANTISKILAHSSIQDRAYNLAFSEPKKLEELIADIGTIGLGLKGEEVKGRIVRGPGEWFLPSVTRGGLDIDRVKQELQFEPTSWGVALGEIADFYESAMWKFPEEREELINDLLEDLGLKSDGDRKKAFLDAILADAAKKPKIEL